MPYQDKHTARPPLHSWQVDRTPPANKLQLRKTKQLNSLLPGGHNPPVTQQSVQTRTGHRRATPRPEPQASCRQRKDPRKHQEEPELLCRHQQLRLWSTTSSLPVPDSPQAQAGKTSLPAHPDLQPLKEPRQLRCLLGAH